MSAERNYQFSWDLLGDNEDHLIRMTINLGVSTVFEDNQPQHGACSLTDLINHRSSAILLQTHW